MLGIQHWLSVPRTSAFILRWIFYYCKIFGASNFHLKSSTEGKLKVEEDSNRKWKWIHAVYRLGFIILYLYFYIYWIVDLIDLTEITLHTFRLIIATSCCVCMLRLQFFEGQELTELINKFLRLFQKVRNICQPNGMGFGGKAELILLSLMLVTLIHRKVFLIEMFLLETPNFYLFGWTSDFYISFGNQLLMNCAFLWYLALGLQFSHLNEFVQTQLRFQLEALETNPTLKKLREARRTLDKCLTLYQDLLVVTSQFQRIFDKIVFLALIQNCSDIVVFSYKMVVQLQFDFFWFWTEAFLRILNMLLFCLSVHRAILHFRVIRNLMLENCYLSDIKDWHRTLDMFLTHLSLHELQVCPLGLFKVSNELLLMFLSALVNYFTVILQYGIQQNLVAKTLEQLNYVSSQGNP